MVTTRLTPHLPSQLHHQPKDIGLSTPSPRTSIQKVETYRLQHQPLDGQNFLSIVLQLLDVDRGNVDLGSPFEQVGVPDGVGGDDDVARFL